jgi:predicted Zn-dependent protease
MKRYLKLIPVMAVVLLTVILVRCAVNPVTGKKEIMLISESMEIDMGKEIDRGLRLEYGLYNDPRLREHVRQMGMKQVPFTHRPHLEYHFEILDTPVENAFAAPGGYIYITRGLLAMLNSEAELAAVLGHELGHVNARHSARQMTRSILVTLGIILAGELSEDIKKITPISMIAAQLLFLKYSRSDEYQADALGIQYSFKAGYSSGEMVRFFGSLQRLTESKGGGHLPNFLSTHPMTPRRVERIKELLATPEYSQTPGGTALVIGKNEYLKLLDGLVYGQNPRQGFVEGQAFYHPDMKFYFKIPYGWNVSNTARQVTLAPKNGKAVIIFKAEDTTESLDTYSTKMTKSLTNPQVLQQGFLNVNGLNAFHTLLKFSPDTEKPQEKEEGEAYQPKEEINVQVSCIRKQGTVFTFFTAAGTSDYSSFQYDINNTVNSFKPLFSPKHLRRRPVRVYVKRARGGETLGRFLQRLRIPNRYWKKIALINGMETHQQLDRNQLVKVLR